MLGPTLRLALGLTAVVGALLAVAAVLVAHRHTGWAGAAYAAAVVSAAAGGGPLSLLVPTIKVDAPEIAPLPSYAAPLWWAMLGSFLLLVAAATAAGACLRGWRSLAVSVPVVAAAAALSASVAQFGGAPRVAGWKLAGAPPAYGSVMLTSAVAAAPVAGGAAAALAHRWHAVLRPSTAARVRPRPV